jgi:hypothetical protein
MQTQWDGYWRSKLPCRLGETDTWGQWPADSVRRIQEAKTAPQTQWDGYRRSILTCRLSETDTGGHWPADSVKKDGYRRSILTCIRSRRGRGTSPWRCRRIRCWDRTPEAGATWTSARRNNHACTGVWSSRWKTDIFRYLSGTFLGIVGYEKLNVD